jgi:hypothetical protein
MRGALGYWSGESANPWLRLKFLYGYSGYSLDSDAQRLQFALRRDEDLIAGAELSCVLIIFKSAARSRW